ncbi:MAG: CoA-binding protein [Rhodospirillaceae bacterium]
MTFRHSPDVLPDDLWSRIPYPDDYLASVLDGVKSIAVVGFSATRSRPSHDIALFLKAKGYRVIPVNPGLAGQEFLGQTVRARLSDVPAPIDLVNVFRNSDAAGAVVDEAIAVAAAKGIHGIWLQSGIRSDSAAQRAEAAGLKVVMNRCIKVEIARLHL